MFSETNKIAGWGNYPVMKGRVLQAENIAALKEHIEPKDATYTVRGNGRSYGDAAMGDNVISTLKLNSLLKFDADRGEVSCQAGALIADLLPIIIAKGFFLPVMPGTKFITIGGAVAADVHGKNHFRQGSFSKHIISLKILLDNADIVECTPENNSGLFYATCGGMGLTGIITEVTFKLMRIESAFLKVKNTCSHTLGQLFELFGTLEGDYKVAWLDCFTRKGICTTGNFALPAELNDAYKAAPLFYNPAVKWNVPFTAPSWLINNTAIKLMNRSRWKSASTATSKLIGVEEFFFPLDAVLHWNRLYGPKGFVQYQYAVPASVAESGTTQILDLISASPHKCLLAVIKQFGKCDGKSPLSFPIEGFTVALDFKIEAGLFDLLNKLDEVVVKCGGRIYLAKDARMNRETMLAGYTEIEKFKEVLSGVNADNKFTSAQSTRIGYLK